MNSNQYASLVRTVLKMLGAFLLTHGYTTAGNFVNGQALAGAVLGIVGILLSLITHSADPTSPPPTSSKPPLLLWLALMLPALLFSGCSTTPQQVTYQAAGTTVVTVDTAMNLWGAYVAAAHPGTNAETQVKSAYEHYQASMAVVADAGAAYSATGGTNGTAVAALQVATGNASTELLDLENLIQSFGVKLNQ